MLNIKEFIFSPFDVNAFVVWDEASKESAIIDPGCYSNEEKNKLEKFIAEKELKVKYLFNTHCHIDHIFGNAFVKTKFNPEFIIPKEDLFLLEMGEEQGKMFGLELDKQPEPDDYFSEEKILSLGEISFSFIFTPGHTPGEFCIYSEKEKICFTGDVLFKEGIGRTDLWGGNYSTLINSIKNKLFALPDDVKIYPGHGEASTIGYEKSNNPFF